MPRPRLEKAELFVVHLIHFAEKFDDDPVRAPVVDRNIVPDDVAKRSPGQRILFLANRSLARLISDQSRTSNAI